MRLYLELLLRFPAQRRIVAVKAAHVLGGFIRADRIERIGESVFAKMVDLFF